MPTLKIKTKLLATFILVSLIPLLIVTVVAIRKANQALQDEVVAKFTAVQEGKANHIKDVFSKLRTAMKSIKGDPYLNTNMVTFNDAFVENGNTVKNSMWQTMVDFKEPPIKAMVQNNGFLDLLLISSQGNIVYTVAKGADLGLNLLEGELAQKNLGKAFKSAMDSGDDEILFADFEIYDPATQDQAAFMLARMKDDFGEVSGYVAIRIPGQQFNTIIHQRSGMGETGESYLVGKSNGVSTLRSDRLVKKKSIGAPESNPYIESALAGQSGSAIITNEDGSQEFIRYDPMNLPGLNWAMITTAATSEVFGAVHSLRNTVIVIIFGVAAVVIALSLGLTSVLFKPVHQTVLMLKDIAEGEGDLTKRLAQDRKDEMGEMALWFNTLMDKIHTIISQVVADSANLNQVSTSLSGIAGDMNQGVTQMSQRADQVAGASGDMSGNMTRVSAISEDTAANVNLIAAATEEMAATAREIAENSEKARSITDAAVAKAGEATAKVDGLGSAADEISNVTQVITDISGQTNLLALNATIEAARAGEAGKGFAVVASEIKELAAQTAEASLRIKARIEGIQHATTDTVKYIEEISSVISEVNEIVTAIATAVEEQSVTSQEIAGNVAAASESIQDMNDKLTENATVANTISGDMGEFNTAVQRISGSSKDIRTNSENLSRLADKLHQMVGRFKI